MFSPNDIKEYLRLIYVEVRSFLLSDKAREVLVFLFFVLVSLGFWLLNTLDDTYRTDFRVPVRLKNVPKEVVLTTDFPDEVKVRVEDRGTVLLNYMLGRTFYPVSFDFNDYTQTSASHIRISSADLRSRITSQLNSTTNLISVQPDTFDIIYAHGEERRVPVRTDARVEAGKQKYIAEVLFEPDTVIAYAPREILDTLKAVYTERFEVTGLMDTLQRRVALHTIRGAKIVPAYVDMTICTDIYSEQKTEVPVVGVGFPPDKILRTFPSKVFVIYQVGLQNNDKVKADDFLVCASYEDVKSSEDGKLPLRLKSSPDFVSHLRLSPPEVDFLIEQQTMDFLSE